MRSHSYLNSAKRIIDEYDGAVPFATWLKEYFRNNKKFGGKDRKQISNLCFGYLRTYHLFKDLNLDEHLIKGLFLITCTPSIVLEELNKDLQESIELPLDEKIKFLKLKDHISSIFPFKDQLSEEINCIDFCKSFLVQPDLFLRIRPGNGTNVLLKLVAHEIDFIVLKDDCIQMSSNVGIDKILEIDKEVVIQDVNSQSTLSILSNYLSPDARLSMWDCCAASGGKSILFHDKYPQSLITVSDVREKILFNLEKRFHTAGIKNYKKFITDLSSGYHNRNLYDIIVCDAPCSGSGTWSRSPEQLKFFTSEKINQYAQLQQKIARNVAGNVKKDGYLLYITCSVFKKENEEVTAFIQSNTDLTLIHQQYFKGYTSRADTLFAALFKA